MTERDRKKDTTETVDENLRNAIAADLMRSFRFNGK